MSIPPKHRALIIAVIGGVVFALTSPPTDLYPAVVIGLALLAFAVADAPSFWRAFGRGAAWGTAAGVVGLRFVPAVIQRFTPLGSVASYTSLVVLAAAQSLCWALCAGVTAVLLRRARAPFELSFAAGVMLALLVPTVFAWTPAGLVSPWPSLVQLADLIGERGVSVIFAVGAALFARAALAAVGRAPGPPPDRALDHTTSSEASSATSSPTSSAASSATSSAASLDSPRKLRFSKDALIPAAIGLVLFATLAAIGSFRIASIERASESLPRARVGLVSQAVGPTERWDRKNHPMILSRLLDLSRTSESRGAELTIWAEAAYPYPLDHEVRRAPRDARAVIGQGVRGPLLIGLITMAKATVVDNIVERNSYNSATIVAPDGSMQPPSDKLQLLWFGEMVPGGAYLPWLRRIFQKSGGLIPGAEPRGLELARSSGPSLSIGVLNCYEDTLADVGRLVTTMLRPNILVNVTNDAWFTGTAEPELHARLAVMRAVENRRDLVRAVNDGVTSWVSASGVVRARDDRNEPFVMMADPAIRDRGLTPYALVGDAPIIAALLVGSLWFAWRARRKRPEGRAPDPKSAAPSPSDEGAGSATTP